MRNFFKVFFACFLALAIFFLILTVAGVGLFSAASKADKPIVKKSSVLVVDLTRPILEQEVEAGLPLPGALSEDIAGLYKMIEGIRQAAEDSAVKGMYLTGAYNLNEFATSQELRQAILDFKKTGKFILAYNNYYDQRSYGVANLADSIYLNPIGSLEWQGYAYQLVFFKDALDRLKVKPEVFYAGNFKSATEPFRLKKMSDANRLQMTELVEDMYSEFLMQTASERKMDTTEIRRLASDLSLTVAEDARKAGLVDDLLYDDEVKEKIAAKTKAADLTKINFISLKKYIEAREEKDLLKDDRIALVFAQGEIVDGQGEEGEIGGERFRQIIRKVRLDKKVKAVVLRVNSPGGSALASEVIWRELSLLKKEKPLVVSMGDYAASGGYYISCMGDSIFAMPGTLTGSIGVFSLLFDVSAMMSEKLGISFDEVSTSQSASLGSPLRPMTDKERAFIQRGVDSIYSTFKQRVAAGRKLSMEYVDSIAQGRVWGGRKAVSLGLADRIGTLHDAIACAARMAKVSDYSIRQWPEVVPFFERIFGKKDQQQVQTQMLQSLTLDPEVAELLHYARRLKGMQGRAQARLPFFTRP